MVRRLERVAAFVTAASCHIGPSSNQNVSKVLEIPFDRQKTTLHPVWIPQWTGQVLAPSFVLHIVQIREFHQHAYAISNKHKAQSNPFC